MNNDAELFDLIVATVICTVGFYVVDYFLKKRNYGDKRSDRDTSREDQ